MTSTRSGENNASLQDWDILEDQYRANLYDGTGVAGQIKQKTGSHRFVVTAPHAVNHHRNGRVKLADRWTGSLAEIVASHTESGYLIATGTVPDWHTWSTRCDDFKSALDAEASTGAFILDLHGMSDKYEIDLCIGLGPKPSSATDFFATQLAKAMRPKKVSINEPFSAKPEYTVASYIQLHTHGNAIQIEIAAKHRNPSNHTRQPGDFILQFIESVREIVRAR